MAMDRTDIETGRLLSAVVTWPEAQLTEHGTACLGSFGEFGLNRLLIRETLLNARSRHLGIIDGDPNRLAVNSAIFVEPCCPPVLRRLARRSFFECFQPSSVGGIAPYEDEGRFLR